jgi:hypothetical protein
MTFGAGTRIEPYEIVAAIGPITLLQNWKPPSN